MSLGKENTQSPLIVDLFAGGGGTAGISTTTLSVGEFAEYIQQIEAYAASGLGIHFVV
jgi:hypothetical protein